MIFDTHTHYDDRAFAGDREELLDSLRENGIGAFTACAASKKSLRDVPELVERVPFAYGALGLHPDETGDLDGEAEELIRTGLKRPRMVAVGEIGLDYHWMVQPKEKQQEAFIRQVMIAKEFALPVIVHSRDAAEDTREIIRSHYSNCGDGEPRGVIHCFSYSANEALFYTELGFFIGVGGVVTYKNGRRLKETVEAVPLRNIVLETDCPYLSPEPLRGKRNSSLNLSYVVREIARIKKITPEEVEEATFANAKRLFRI